MKPTLQVLKVQGRGEGREILFALKPFSKSLIPTFAEAFRNTKVRRHSTPAYQGLNYPNFLVSLSLGLF